MSSGNGDYPLISPLVSRLGLTPAPGDEPAATVLADWFFGTTGGGSTNISATKQSLVLTTNAATIARAFGVSATRQSLVLTPTAAALTRAFAVAATRQTLTLTPLAATAAFGKLIAATVASLTLTPRNATLTRNVSVAAALQALALSPQAAGITYTGGVSGIPVIVAITGSTGDWGVRTNGPGYAVRAAGGDIIVTGVDVADLATR